jgi:hypothetical protein
MTRYVIVGAGPAGLYTAYRLLKDGNLKTGDTVKLYEWSHRPGGRIYTYTFPNTDFPNPDGVYCEFGGMRFATDPHFDKLKDPAAATTIQDLIQGHVLVQNLIYDLDLTEKVVPFVESTDRLYYLRGKNIYQNHITSLEVLPYNFNSEIKSFIAKNKVEPPYTSDTILGAIGSAFAYDPTSTTDPPAKLGSSNADRSKWCDYYATGTVPEAQSTPSFPSKTLMQNIGYWNLLYDQLGDEGFDYSADGAGYTSNVINWNAADAMQANNDYGSTVSYSRIDGGFSVLFETLAAKITTLMQNFPGSGMFFNHQLASLEETATDSTTTCVFKNDTGELNTVVADQLFLAMPRRSLELIAGACPSTYVLNNPDVKRYIESSIDQPAIKVVMVFKDAWWADGDCQHKPKLEPDTKQGVGGPTITDLPLRQIYYFGNNIPKGPGKDGGPYVLLASYDDMSYSNFWRELEVSQNYKEAPSLIRQPLSGPTSVPVTSSLAQMLIKQLADVHGISVDQISQPLAVYFQDWGQDPFGAGYHGWAPHYNICEVMDNIRAPYHNILNQPSGRNLYIIGSCYSFDQAWVEGAFCTAESVLQDFLNLPPINNVSGYTLVCKVQPK